MQQITAKIEYKALSDAGKFEGYASVFNVIDNGGDVILPGAFKSAKTTRDGKIRIARDHNYSRLVGKSDYSQDAHGLHVRGQLNMNVSYVPDTYELMKSGELDGLSVGFNVLPGGVEWKEGADGELIRYISAAELWEYSIVPFGMNDQALISDVKNSAEFDTRNHLHQYLTQRCGFAEKQASALLAGGYKSFFNASRHDADTMSPATLADIKTMFDEIHI